MVEEVRVEEAAEGEEREMAGLVMVHRVAEASEMAGKGVTRVVEVAGKADSSVSREESLDEGWWVWEATG